jgi:hypothetical protein
MMTLFLKGYEVKFDRLNQDLYQASVTDGTRSLPIYLLFEHGKIGLIEKSLEAVPFKKDPSLDFFKMVVAGCIRTCMRLVP